MSAFPAKNSANDASVVSPAQSLDAVRDILFGAQSRDMQGRIDETTRRIDSRMVELDTQQRQAVEGLRGHVDAGVLEQQRQLGVEIQKLRDEVQALDVKIASAMKEAELQTNAAMAALRKAFDEEMRLSATRAHGASEALRAAALALAPAAH